MKVWPHKHTRYTVVLLHFCDTIQQQTQFNSNSKTVSGVTTSVIHPHTVNLFAHLD